MKPSFPPAISSTARGAFASCPRKFEYSFLRNLARGETSVHLIAGGAFAKGCEVVRREYYDHFASPIEALGAGAEAMILFWGEYEPPAGSAKTLPNMLAALAEYFTVYDLPTERIIPLKGENAVSAIEFSFALPIPGTIHPETGDPILYMGRFDMLGQVADDLWVVDEKTTTQLGASWINNWTLRGQLTGYCWAAREYGYPVVGALIRGISILSKSFGHAESVQYRPQYMIDRWLKQLIRDTKRMCDLWKEGYWDMNFDQSCSTYGGCEFLSVCSAKDPEVWLVADFVEREWNYLLGEGG